MNSKLRDRIIGFFITLIACSIPIGLFTIVIIAGVMAPQELARLAARTPTPTLGHEPDWARMRNGDRPLALGTMVLFERNNNHGEWEVQWDNPDRKEGEISIVLTHFPNQIEVVVQERPQGVPFERQPKESELACLVDYVDYKNQAGEIGKPDGYVDRMVFAYITQVSAISPCFPRERR